MNVNTNQPAPGHRRRPGLILSVPGTLTITRMLAVGLLLSGLLIAAGCGSDSSGGIPATTNSGGHYEGNAGSVGTVSDSATGGASGPSGSTVGVNLPPGSNANGTYNIGFYPETVITGVDGTGNVSPVAVPIQTQATAGSLSFDVPLLLDPGTYEIQISSSDGRTTYNSFTFTVTPSSGRSKVTGAAKA